MEKLTLYAALENIEGMPKAQRDIFERYRGNSFLEDAIRGERPLEEVCKELAAPFMGRMGECFRPYAKDSVHNDKVKELGELIPASGLRKRGIYFPDNFITSIGYTIAGGLALLGNLNLTTSYQIPELGWLSLPIAMGMIGIPFVLIATMNRYTKSSLMSAN
ncbi:MAG: hypothetical protein AABY26_03365, partial [Nanoarchaeota archaeon]